MYILSHCKFVGTQNSFGFAKFILIITIDRPQDLQSLNKLSACGRWSSSFNNKWQLLFMKSAADNIAVAYSVNFTFAQ